MLILTLVFIVAALVLLFAFTNGFHDAANVVATIIMTGALSPRKALLMAAACEFVAPFFLGAAVAKVIGEDIIDLSGFGPATLLTSAAFVIAALVGAIGWNLITWAFGFPSSSSHALVGGMVGSVLAAYGAGEILWKGLLYVILSLIISPLLGLVFGYFVLKAVFYLSKDATPKINRFFKLIQIPTSIALALSHGANDVQKSIGLLTMSMVILGRFRTFHIPFWIIFSCGIATGLGTASGGWRIIITVGSRILHLKPVHAFCAQTSSAMVILGASLMGGPVSTTHVVSSSIMGVGAGYRASAVRWGVAKNIIMAWFITIPVAGLLAALSFLLIRFILLHISLY